MSLSSLASVGRAGLIRKGVASAGRASPRIHPHSPRGHIHKSKHKIGPRGVPPISICVEGEIFSLVVRIIIYVMHYVVIIL